MKIKIVTHFIFLSLLFVCLVLVPSDLTAQGIRMHYEEMTNQERDDLMAAYFTSGGPSGTSGLVNDIANFHASNFSSIHFNNITNDVFFAWHRQASQELERELKNISGNEWVVIPYWNWSLSPSKSDDLWQSNWIGPFNTPWNLSRSAASGINMNLAGQVTTALTQTNFFQFSRWDVEGSAIHFNGHNWTGGVMTSSNSPKDPAFFFHHNMVDKVWADWYRIHDDPNVVDNYYIQTSLPRYPGVDPDDLNDPRSLGIFYADMGLAVLDKYTVSNTHTSSEKFGYQFVIESGDDFLIPSGNNAEFRSCEEIVLKPGFLATAGSSFQARIDQDCDFSTAAIVSNDPPAAAWSREDANSGNDIANISTELRNFPNPFTHSTTIEFGLKAETTLTVEIVSLTGQQIAMLRNNETFSSGRHQINFDATHLPAGLYLCNLRGEDGSMKHIRLIKQ